MPHLASSGSPVRAAWATPAAATAAAATAMLLLVVTLAAAAPDPAHARVAARPAAGDPQVGVVQTLAGPGYCPHTGVAAEGSRQVRSVAVDADGRVFSETGPPDDRAVIATVDEHGRVATLVSRISPPAAAPGASAGDTAAAGAGRMAADGAGGVLVAAGTSIVHIGGDHSRTTVAGDPAGDPGGVGSESTGNGGPAVDARFRSATALAQDTDGNLYVADHGGVALDTATVRFINRSDTPATFYPDTDAELTVQPGHIARVAGARDQSGADDSVEADESDLALSATLGGTTTLAVHGERLYIAVTADRSGGSGGGRPTVRLVNLGGEPVTAHAATVEPAGIGVVAGGGDDPTTTLDSVAGIAVDADGVLLVTDPARHRIRAVDDEGFMSVVAGAEGLGSDVGGFNSNNRPAVGARLDRPVDVAVGPQGEVYVADHNNEQVRVVDDTGLIRAVPGAGVGLTWECDGPEASTTQDVRPQPGGPASVATNDDGHIYFTLADEHQVKRLTPNGQVTTVAGRTGDGCALGCAGFAGDHGPALDAELDSPTAVATGPDGGLYVYDGGNARVRYINLGDAPVTVHTVTVDPGHIATVAGTGTPGTPDAAGEAGQALDADLGEVSNPGLVEHGASAATDLNVLADRNLGAVAVDSAGNLFIAETRQDPDGGAFQQPLGRPDTDFLDAQVRQVDPDGQITTVAGSDAAGPASACCKNPSGLAVDAADNLYIADASTYQVWLLNRSSDAIHAHGQTVAAGDAAVVAGSGTPGFDGDGGPATRAELLSPAGLAIDDHDRLHIAEFDPRGSYIRTVDAEGTIDVLVGNGRSGFNGDSLDRRQTSVNLPTDLAVDACGNLLVADAGNDRIRRITLTGDCDPTGHQAANPTDNRGLDTTTMGFVALAAAVGLGGFTAGWYWRRRTRSSAPTQPSDSDN